MKILDIELIGYKRLSLTHINRIYIQFVEKVLFILGTNGSGKSSLLKELSPLPAQSAQYEKNGSKKVHIEHQGFLYRLLSDFSINRHSFIKIHRNEDGSTKIEKELNPGGTQTIQRELVKKEFGITPELHELFIGVIKFHRMSVSERRKWFTLFSRSDYTYALSVYQKFKEAQRNAQVNLKMIQSRILQEKDKILSPEKEKEIQDILEYIKENLLELKEKQKNFYDQKASESKIASLLEQTRHITRVLQRKTSEYQRKLGQRHLSSVQIEELFTDFARRIKDLQVSIDLREKDLQNLQNIQTQLQKNANMDTQGLKRKLEYLQSDYSKKQSELKLLRSVPISDYESMMQHLDHVSETLSEIFQTVHEDPEHRNTRENFISIKEKIGLEKKNLETLINQSIRIKLDIDRFEHSKKHNETTCPKCNHIWIRNYEEKDDLNAKQQYLQVLETIEKTKIILDNDEKRILEMTEFFEKHKAYYQIVYYHPILKPLWTLIEKTDLLFKDPKRLTALLENFKLEIREALKLPVLSLEIQELGKLIETVEKSLVDSNIDLKTKIEMIQEEVHTFLKEQRQYKEQTASLNELVRLFLEIEQQQSTLEGVLSTIENEKERWLKQNMLLYIQSITELLETEADKYHKQLIQVDRQKHTIATLVDQEKELEKRIEALKLLTSELSPSEGLIAKGMMGFIHIFLVEINQVLKQIWLYPLELVAEQFKDEETQELDYKFKLRVNDNDANVVPDIQVSSSAMKEVIDLSFQITCMKYLGMMDYPLFLDEFGHSMDSAHRMEATKTVHDLANHGSFSQIFIISHFENNYGTFKNAQMNVLCKNNIIIPKDMKYNDYMVIEN